MTDPSPLLPSQVSDASSKPTPWWMKKPTPWWMKMIKFCLVYVNPLTVVLMFMPWFEGASCPELPHVLAIFGLLAAFTVISVVLTMIHNCKAKTFLDPQQLTKPEEEMYKGHKALFIISSVLGLGPLACGIWALVYGIPKQHLRGVGQCGLFLNYLLPTGGIIVGIYGLIVIGGIGYAIYMKVKGSSESSESNNFSA